MNTRIRRTAKVLILGLLGSLLSAIPLVITANSSLAATLDTLQFPRNKVASAFKNTGGRDYAACYRTSATCTVQRNSSYEFEIPENGYIKLEQSVNPSAPWRVTSCTAAGSCSFAGSRGQSIGYIYAYKPGEYFLYRAPNSSYNWVFSLGDANPYLVSNSANISWSFDGPGTGREGEYSARPSSVTAAITGEGQVGRVLTAATTYVGVDAQVSYQWKRSSISNMSSSVDIVGASNSTYTTTSDDAGKYVAVTITVSNFFGSRDKTSDGFEIQAAPSKLDPTFSSPTSTYGGFTVNVTNYDATYTYAATVSVGSVSVGTPSGTSLPLTVRGLNSARGAIVTVTTNKSGATEGRSTVAGTSLASAITTSTGPVGRWIASSVARTSKTLLIANQQGYLYTSSDIGVNWVQRAGIRNWSAVAQSDDGTVMFATAAGGQIFKSTDSGSSWTAVATNQNWRAIACDADCSVVVAAVSGGKVWLSTNSGSTWTEKLSNATWRSVALSDDGATILALPYNGQPAISTDTGVNWGDGGNIWQKPQWVGAAVSPDGARVIGAQLSGFVVSKTLAGVGWSFDPGDNPVTAMAYTRDFELVMRCGTAGQISVKGGGGQSDLTAPEQVPWSSCAMSGDGSVRFGTTNTGLLYISRDDGASWETLSLTTGNIKRRAIVASESGNQIFAAVYGGKIEYSSDSGNTWSVALDVSQNWIAIAASNNLQKIYALAYRGYIYRSLDSGVTWSRVNDSGGPLNWISVAVSEDGSKVIVAEMGGNLYTSTDSGAEFVPRESKRKWTSVASSSNGSKLVAAVDGGFIYTSADSGATWAQRATSQKWSAVASSSSGQQLVATVAQGRIYVSSNSGTTWSAKSSDRNWLNVAVSASGKKMVAVVGSGRIYTSSNSGSTWTARESTRNWRALFMTGNGNRVFAADFGKKLYSSSNSGETWTAL